MIVYNVWFCFKPGSNEATELAKTRSFLDDMRGRSKLHDYRLMRNRASRPPSKLPGYHLMAEFIDEAQFKLPFAEVLQTGVHLGKHGVMIENVDNFTVEVFEDV